MELADILEKTALLASLSRAEIQSLAGRTVLRRFSSGELLFSENDPCRGLYIVARGKVRIFKTSMNGREQVLAMNHAGESVAELPVLDGGQYPASAMAAGEVELIPTLPKPVILRRSSSPLAAEVVQKVSAVGTLLPDGAASTTESMDDPPLKAPF